MFKNYLKVALRRFKRGGTHAIVNIVGLALGMATCTLLFLMIHHEWSYDRFHENIDATYRVYLEYTPPEGEQGYQAMMRPGFTQEIKDTFPGIGRATTFVASERDFRVGDEMSRHRLAEIDADFFEIFTFPALAGDPVTAIADPTSIVLTAEAATHMFGVGSGTWHEALGRGITIPDDDVSYDFSVGAVLAPIPNNSSIDFDVAISFENYDNIYVGGNNWGGRTSTYVELTESTDAMALEATFPPFTDSVLGEYIEDMRSAENISMADGSYALRLQPLQSMHQDIEVFLPYEASAHNPMYSWILSGIGFLILLIACINFMTLSVGQSTIRAREVGVRKVLGANRSRIMRQHWGESVVLAAISLGIGLVIALIVLPAFNNLVGTDLGLGSVSPVLLVVAIVLLITVVGVGAGSYPAAVLSAFRPAYVLKGNVASPRNGLLTRSLVVLQFTVSIALIVCTVIMTNQLNFMLNRNLGFEDDFVLAVDANQVGRSEADGVLTHFRDNLLSNVGVAGVTRSGSSFTRGSDRNGWADGAGVNRQAYNFGVSPDWIDVLGMKIIEGRNFDRDRPSDATNSILVNEALVREFGIEEPVGYVMTNWLSFVYEESPTIIGVVEDFNFRSLREEVQPAIMNMHPGYYNYMGAILIKVRPDNVPSTIAAIEQTWNEVLPGKPFRYSFLDQDLATQYETEKRWQSIVTYSSILAIVIACLGLFGLAILAVGRRTKEIGIRKVLGASVTGVTALLSREFAIMVLVASVVATPLAYFAMSSWLQTFAFRVTIGPGAFIGAMMVALLIAMGTVGIHSIRAARANPVRSLRYE